MSKTDLLYFESELWQDGCLSVAGIDEAGRGPLAGPVVAAAVIFPAGHKYIAGINDSKKLTSITREEMIAIIQEVASAIGIGIVHHQEIDEINILQATFKAMREAIAVLQIRPDFLLIDGNKKPGINVPQRCIVKGDSLSMSIAAASIVAKVTRDRMMLDYDRVYPQYGFARHKGYATARHIEAIRRFGLCPIHRRSFKPEKLKELYAENE